MSIPDWMRNGKKSIPVPTDEPPQATPPPPAASPPAVEVLPSDFDELASVPAPRVQDRRVEPRKVERPAVSAPPPRLPKVTRYGESAKPPRRAERAVAKEGKRLKVSITATQAVAGGVVLLVLVAVVFWLGKSIKSSSSPAAKAPKAAGAQAARSNPPPPVQARSPLTAIEQRRSEPKEPSPPPRAAVKDETAAADLPRSQEVARQRGKYYLIIQGLMGMENRHRVEAEAIANFLNSNGEPVTVNIYKGTPQQYIVMSQRAFDDPNSPEARKYLRAIEEQGRLYRNQGGKYDFKQGESGWFVRM